MLSLILAWVFPLRRVHRQALLAAPNNGHSLFQQPPYAVRADIWWGPPLTDSSPYSSLFSCFAGINFSFDYDDPAGCWKCTDSTTYTQFADSCLAGAHQGFAHGKACAHWSFHTTASSACQMDETSSLALLLQLPRECSYAVHTLTGRVVDVHVCAVETIAVVKAVIQVVEGVPPAQQRLVCGGQLLLDGRSMNDYNLSCDSITYLVVSHRGGAKKQRPSSEPGDDLGHTGSDVVCLGGTLAANQPLPDASESLYVGCFGRFWDYCDHNCGPAAFAVLLEVAYYRAKVPLPINHPLGKLVMARRESICDESDAPCDRAVAMLEFHSLCLQVTSADRTGMCHHSVGHNPVLRCSTLFEQFAAFVGTSGPAYEAARETRTSSAPAPFARLLLRPDQLLHTELGSYLSVRGGKHPALLAVDVGRISLEESRYLNVPVNVLAPVWVANGSGGQFVHAEYRCAGALYCNKHHWKCTVSCPEEFVWEYDSVGQTKLVQVPTWTHAWPRKCKLEASYGPAIFVYVHTPGTGRPEAPAVPVSPQDGSTWAFRCVREEDNIEREKMKKMGSYPYYHAGILKLADNYGRMAKEGKAYLASLSDDASDSESTDTDDGTVPPSSFDATDAFTITSGPDRRGKYVVSQGVVSWRVSAELLGEVAITAYKVAQAEKNGKAVAKILLDIEANDPQCSDADMEAITDKNFASVMEELEGAGSISKSAAETAFHGVAPQDRDPSITDLSFEAAGVPHPFKKKRVHGLSLPAQGNLLPTVDCAATTPHTTHGPRTWKDVHSSLVLGYQATGVRSPFDAANVRVVRRVLHTKTGLCAMPGLDPAHDIALLTEHDGQNGEVPPALHWFNVSGLSTALELCGVNVGVEVVVLDELPMTRDEWSAMVGGDGTTVCRYGNRPRWSTLDDPMKCVYLALHEAALSSAEAARLQMDDPRSSVMCVIGKDRLHWAVLIRPALKAGTSILDRIGVDITSTESWAFRDLGFNGTCADVSHKGDCGPHCVAVALALLGRPLFVGRDDNNGGVSMPNAVPPSPTPGRGTSQFANSGRRTSGQGDHAGALLAKGNTVFRFGRYQGHTWREVQSGTLGERSDRWIRWACNQPNASGGLKDFVKWINACATLGHSAAGGVEEASQPASLPSSPCPLPLGEGAGMCNGTPPRHARHMRLEEHPLSVPHAEGAPAPTGLHRPFWREFNLTEHLLTARGEPSHVVSAQQFKEGDFALAVDILGPVIRQVSGADHFACMLKPRAHPRGWWADKQHWPPTYSKKTMPRFGAIYRCDYHRCAGCPVTLTIMREFARHPDQFVFSLEISTAPHRHACNHARTFNTKTLGPGVYLPALHPVVDSFLRAQARANPRVAPSAVMPLLVEHLQNTTHLHCQLCHAEDTTDVAYKASRLKDAPLCFHQSTHMHLARLPSFLGADRLPGIVRGTAGCTTRDVYVKVHHMLMEDGHAASGTYGMQVLNREQIQRTLLDYKHKFGGASALNGAMPANGSMKEHYRSFESENLYLYWTNSLSKRNVTLYDIYEWRMIALLYTDARAGQGETAKPAVAAGSRAGADSASDGAIPKSVGPGHEYVVCYASMASLITSVMAWACREESGGVQIGVDHMYNCVKGCDNVSLAPNLYISYESSVCCVCEQCLVVI